MRKLTVLFTAFSFLVGCGGDDEVGLNQDEEPKPTSDTLSVVFPSNPQNILTNSIVTFALQTSKAATTWSWTFEGGEPEVSTEENPTVSYSSSGIYEVSVTVSDGINEETYTDKDFIIASSKFHHSPPYSGTIWIESNIITEEDPTMYKGITYQGTGMRTMYDRRVEDWVQLDAHIIKATFEQGITLEVQVNPEFDKEQAMAHASFYAEALGRIPRAFFEDAQTVWIHDGVHAFGGGNNNFLIHVGQGEEYVSLGILEETFVHEGCHTSFDDDHASNNGWLNAQQNDFTFISTYARDHPQREDVAESYLMILAATHLRDRIGSATYNTILGTIPERIRYFNDQEVDLYPLIQ